jgi:ribonuclease P/MRP protein subunit RPP1
VICNDPSVTHAMARSQTIRMYNIIAALPLTDTALQHACQNFIGDIITYNTKTIRLRLNRKFYYLALRRNMFFELKYSPAIKDSNERRSTITRSHQCHLTGRSRGIILSSGAEDRFEIRSPCDVANLGLIFNLTEDQAKSAVNSICFKVLIAAESRRLGKNPVIAKYQDIDTSTSEDDEEEVDTDEPNSKKIKLS